MENFDHPHIIKLIGICLDDSYAIVMELAKFGQLRTYLQINKDQLEMAVLILYAYQICTAMAYLENCNFVHR
jgi:focal adhesion kinase 1